MTDPLSILLDERSILLQRISELGDFQPGSISHPTRTCGKPQCHCAKPDDSGHGPHAQLTQKIGGKTVTKNLPSTDAVRKAEREIAEFRLFQSLTSELVELNRKVCRLRPVEQNRGDTAEKKTADAILHEVTREIEQVLRVIFNERRKTGHIDLEATEMALRSTMHQAGAIVLTELLQLDVPPAYQRTIPCPCGQQAHYHGMRSKPLLTTMGPASVSRAYYVCPECPTGQFPADIELDIKDTEVSPGVRRMKAVVAHEVPFDHGRRQMKELAGLDVTAKSVERTAEAIGADIATRQQQEIDRAMQLELPVIVVAPVSKLYIEMDGTGIQVVKKETVGRQGKIAGQPARTREVKLGSVFTQSKCDAKGRPMRDPGSTTYVGAIETAEEFGKRLYVEAWKRGWSTAEMKIVIGDGAAWIWNIADQHLPGAIQIVDLYHAREHLWELARKLFPNDERKQNDWMAVHQLLLDQGKIKKLTVALRTIADDNPGLAEKFRTEANDFHHNALRMRYPKFRRLHLFVGSGVIESGCKTVIGSRLKQSGMFWTVRGANSIVALRCCIINNRFEDYWEERRAA